MSTMPRLRTLALACFAVSVSRAQTTVSTDQATVLQRLGTAAALVHTSLPNFTCNEAAISEEVRGDKVKRRVDFTASLRVVRDTDGSMVESFQMLTLNGKPMQQGDFKLPIYVNGGFDHVLLYFLPEKQACYRYTYSPGRVDFEAVPHTSAPATCRDETGMHGFATLNAEGDVTHLERRIPLDVAKAGNLTPFAASDLAATELNGRRYMLSMHFRSETPDGKSLKIFEATYTACRLFGASFTLLPGSSVIEGNRPESTAPPGRPAPPGSSSPPPH